MLATIVLVLPSQFSGGEVHVSHVKQRMEFDASPSSLVSTTILAWYTDVVHEVKPITSGFRLALAFNVIRKPNAEFTPKLLSPDKPLKELKRILRGWYHADENRAHNQRIEPPTKLAYVLDHQYSHANLSFDKLKGRDRSLVLTVKDACLGHGFHLGLGSLEFSEYGVAEGSRDPGDWKAPTRKKRWCSYDEFEEDECGELRLERVRRRSCKVRLISGPGGEILGGAKELAVEQELMGDGWDIFEELPPDDEDYGGYLGNVRGIIDLG